MMIWNYTDKAVLTMKNMNEEDLEELVKTNKKIKTYMLIMFIKIEREFRQNIIF